MKNFIITIGIIILMSMFLIFQGDMNLYSRHCKKLAHLADDASVSISMDFDENEYGNGYIVYKNDIGNRAYAYIKKNLNETFWKGGFYMTVDCLNETTPEMYTRYKYNESGLLGVVICNADDFPSRKDYDTPRVRVSLTAMKPKFTMKFLSNINTQVTKIGISEYEGHGY